jgi:hypothetical protein
MLKGGARRLSDVFCTCWSVDGGLLTVYGSLPERTQSLPEACTARQFGRHGGRWSYTYTSRRHPSRSRRCIR